MKRALRPALTGVVVLLAGLAAGCSGSSGGGATAGPTPSSATASPTPAVTMSANPIVTPLTTPTTTPTPSAPASAAAGDVPAGSTLVARHDGSGTAYVVYAQPRDGSFCLVLAVGAVTGEQCVRAVPPAHNLDVHTLRAGSTALLAGVTGASVTKVTVDTDDGSSVSVVPVALPGTAGKAFAAAVDPGTVSQVTAYDAGGNVVART